MVLDCLRVVVDVFEVVVNGCRWLLNYLRWLYVVLAGFRSFHVLVTTNNVENDKRHLECTFC